MKNLLLLLFFPAMMFAQRGELQEKMEEVKAMKIAHITSELELSADEAAKFWPVYNAFDQREKELRRERLMITRPKKRMQAEPMSEKDASAALLRLEQNEEELFKEKRKFNAQLRQILPASKIIRLNTAEEDFNRRLLKQYRAKGDRKK